MFLRGSSSSGGGELTLEPGNVGLEYVTLPLQLERLGTMH
jgi:hypothetical protein